MVMVFIGSILVILFLVNGVMVKVMVWVFKLVLMLVLMLGCLNMVLNMVLVVTILGNYSIIYISFELFHS